MYTYFIASCMGLARDAGLESGLWRAINGAPKPPRTQIIILMAFAYTPSHKPDESPSALNGVVGSPSASLMEKLPVEILCEIIDCMQDSPLFLPPPLLPY